MISIYPGCLISNKELFQIGCFSSTGIKRALMTSGNSSHSPGPMLFDLKFILLSQIGGYHYYFVTKNLSFRLVISGLKLWTLLIYLSSPCCTSRCIAHIYRKVAITQLCWTHCRVNFVRLKGWMKSRSGKGNPQNG